MSHTVTRAIVAGLMVAVLAAAVCEARELVPLESLSGAQTSHFFGSTVAALGDVNGDGVPDYAVGAPGSYDGLGAYNEPGAVTVISGLGSRPIYRLSRGEALDEFGIGMDGGPDVDRDGIGDLVVLAPNATSSSGSPSWSVSLYSGATGDALQEWTGAAMSTLNGAVAFVGDLDGDGASDVAVSIDQMVRAFSSRTGAPLFTVAKPGGFTLATFGVSLAGLGDVTGDGVDDFAIGSSYTECTSEDRDVWIVDGAIGQITRQMSFSGGCGDFGRSLVPTPDVDGDGREDLAIGAPSTFSSPQDVYIYSTTSDSLALTIEKPGFGDMGFSVASVRDADGMGDSELFFGAPTAPPPSGPLFRPGALYGYSIAADTLGLFAYGPTSRAALGYSVSAVGDVNGDGRPDVLVGAPGADIPLKESVGGVAVFGFADLAASHVIDPSWSGVVNLASPQPLDLRIEGQPGGSYAPYDVVPETVRLRSASNLFYSLAASTVTPPPTDTDGDGFPEYVARFLKSDLRDYLSFMNRGDDTMTVIVEGNLQDGRRLQAALLLTVDTVPVGVVRVIPNPVVRTGQLSFRTTQAGRAKLSVYNVQGALAGTELVGADVGPGIHDVALGSGGTASLAAGVYFYRLETVDGTFRGRFVFLR
jgi:FG-GAP repeat